MRPRTELALGTGILLVLGVIVSAVGSRRIRTTSDDPRRSTYLAGPSGARGFAEALERLGARVTRYRRPAENLDARQLPRGRRLVVLLGPSLPVTPIEARHLAELPVDLLLAGPGARRVMRCLGYTVVERRRDSLPLVLPARAPFPVPAVRGELVHHSARTVVDSSEIADGRLVTCTVPDARPDTLLRTTSGRAVVLRLRLAGGRTITLVSDDRLFSNRVLRETAAGPFTLSLVLPRYDVVVVDEYHHGYDVTGSLAGAALSWSLQSPWGWAAWQLAVIGVIALLAGAVRFGPVRVAIQRRRRSPLEHVRALATALAATGGHDVAVSLMVQGLRRRLSRTGRAARGDLDRWLDGLRSSVRSPRGKDALATLTALTHRQPSAEEVLQAASAVETLWEELKP